MNDRRQQLQRSLGWVGGGMFAGALLQYALFFGAARYLGAHEYGALSLAMTIALLAAPCCDLGTSVAIVCGGSRAPQDLLRLFGASLRLRWVTFVPVGAAGLAFGMLAGYGGSFALLFPPLFVAAVADGVGNLAGAACQAEDRMGTAARLQFGRHLLRALALLLTLVVRGDAACLAFAYGAASLAGSALAIHAVTRGKSLPDAPGDLWPTVRAALPYGTAILATILHAQIDVALVGLWWDEGEVGQFHAAARFVLLLQMVPQIVSVASAPLAYRTALDGLAPSARIYRVKCTALAMLGLLATILLATHGDLVIRICLGQRFQGCEALLIGLAPVVFVKFLSSTLGDTLSALSRQHLLSIGCWIALGVNLLAGCWWIPTHGAAGAVLATLVSETVLLVFLAVQLLLAGLDLAFRRLLLHPLLVCATAGAVLLVAGPHVAVLAAVLMTALLVLVRPTVEERLLLRRNGEAR